MYHIPCSYCKGKGTLPQFKHVENGICFTCSGTGVQEVTEEEYNEYKKELEQKKLGSYILFNKGNVEYYKTTKEISNKYGSFYCSEYGGYCIHQNYKNKDMVFKESNKNNEDFIKAAKKEYYEKSIKKYNEWIEEETENEWIEKYTEKLNEFKELLNQL